MTFQSPMVDGSNSLTDKGQALGPVLMALKDWGERFN
jgi:DNA-binding HxlR family transcriptional regulator